MLEHRSRFGPFTYLRTLFGLTIAGMGGLIGVVLTIASVVLPPEDGKAEVGVAAAAAFLAASYLCWRAERVRANGLAAQVAGQGRLAFEFRPKEPPFEEDRIHGLYDKINRVFSIKVVNVGGSTVSNCRLWLVSTEPYDGHSNREIMLPRPEADLHPGDGFIAKLASFEEAGPHMSAATMGTLHVPFSADNPKLGGRTLGMEHGATLVRLRATGDGSAPVEAVFKLWFTMPPKPKLRMIMVGGDEA